MQIIACLILQPLSLLLSEVPKTCGIKAKTTSVQELIEEAGEAGETSCMGVVIFANLTGLSHHPLPHPDVWRNE
jgi:hypothetical protein